MCRLLGYATAGRDFSLSDILGDAAIEDFRSLSEIHNDGWGSALLSLPAEPPYRRDGGEPSPETDTRLYQSTVAAHLDNMFYKFANQSARGALWHLRLASSRLPLILENQQPFFTYGLSFIHNGDISDEDGRNIVANRDFPVNNDLYEATGGRSDSAIYFAVVLEFIGMGFALDEAVAQAVRELRKTYPLSSFNCMLQSEDRLVVLRAAGRQEVPPRIEEIYIEHHRADRPDDYRLVRYRTITDEHGENVGVVAGSSGFAQPESDGWKVLGNDQLLVASNRTGEFHIRNLADPQYSDL